MFMRRYHRMYVQDQGSFITTMLRSYAHITIFYSNKLLQAKAFHSWSEDEVLVSEARAIAQHVTLLLADKRAFTDEFFQQKISDVDTRIRTLYSITPKCLEMYPSLLSAANTDKAHSCPFSCGPGDYRPGGKCDLHGCYERKEVSPAAQL